MNPWRPDQSEALGDLASQPLAFPSHAITSFPLIFSVCFAESAFFAAAFQLVEVLKAQA